MNDIIPDKYVDLDASNSINDVVNNNTVVCNTHIPSQDKCAIASAIKSQHDLTYIRNDILNKLKCDAFWSKYKVMTSPGDGHCFIHAAVNSLNGIASASNFDVSVLLKYLFDETVHNADRYIDFIDGNGRESLLHGLNEYVHDRRYDTSFGDLVPIILANALSVNFLIIQNNGSHPEVNVIECRCSTKDHPLVIMVYKTGMHYDSITPVDRHNVAGADQFTHSVLSTYIESDNVPFDGIKVKHTWDLLTIININARSLNAEKVDELQVIVDDYDIAVACIIETWFRGIHG